MYSRTIAHLPSSQIPTRHTGGHRRGRFRESSREANHDDTDVGSQSRWRQRRIYARCHVRCDEGPHSTCNRPPAGSRRHPQSSTAPPATRAPTGRSGSTRTLRSGSRGVHHHSSHGEGAREQTRAVQFVVSSAATVCVRYLVVYVHSPRLIPVLHTNLTTNKSKEIRSTLSEVLVLVLEKWSSASLEKQIPLIADAIRRACGDADSNARTCGRRRRPCSTGWSPRRRNRLTASDLAVWTARSSICKCLRFVTSVS
ncbi:unnamed protein product [Leptidea sinapis]|uniref:Uncharacterized protein n=1 Tax=Leptidea sinapis TaxID=189913 RepID=A0A5E4QTN3_9NEOP|nr:unnamed protein product [Leptidea sinapis]